MLKTEDLSAEDRGAERWELRSRALETEENCDEY